MFKETRGRSTKKSISWRIIAFTNSWIILALSMTEVQFWNAIKMNATGMVMFYFHERIWNKISIGKHKE